MPKRIWFTQQKPFGYVPLRLGLGYEVSVLDILKTEAFCPECIDTRLEYVQDVYGDVLACPKCDLEFGVDCQEETDQIERHKVVPKKFTTRTHPLNGEYIVVEGSRFNAKAKPVEPQIQFKAKPVCMIDFKSKVFLEVNTKKFFAEWDFFTTYDSENGNTIFSEYDLGFRGATFEMLKKELLRLNQKATEETLFFVNRLEPILRTHVNTRATQIGALP